MLSAISRGHTARSANSEGHPKRNPSFEVAKGPEDDNNKEKLKRQKLRIEQLHRQNTTNPLRRLILPQWPQQNIKNASRVPKIAQHGLKKTPRWLQDISRLSQACLLKWPKIAPRRPPRWHQDDLELASRWLQDSGNPFESS